MCPAVDSRKQFTIRALLGLASVAAIAIACWKAIVWEPPTDQFQLYEKARAYHGWTAKIGPNRIRIVSIARNDGDGNLVVATPQAGDAAALAIPYRQALVDCGPWLDAVQIDLRPGGDRVDIVELRVFDHRTRQLLPIDHPACGYRVVRPNLVQLYGCGKMLPPRVDLWMRVHSRATDEVGVLEAKIGSTVTAGQCRFTLAEIQAGFSGWSSREGLSPVEGKHHNETAIVLELNPARPQQRFQIAAVTFDDRIHLYSALLLGLRGGDEFAHFHVPLEEIRHFEIRPWGTRERFFFDGVELPKLTTPKREFVPAPIASVAVGGKEHKQKLTELAPLDVELMLRDGQPYSGSAAGPNFFELTPRADGPINEGTECTLVLMTRGIAGLPYQIRFRRSGSSVWTSDVGWKSGGGLHRASTANQEVFDRNYKYPLAEIEWVEVSIDSQLGRQ